MYVCIYVCIYVCMYVCMYVCTMDGPRVMSIYIRTYGTLYVVFWYVHTEYRWAGIMRPGGEMCFELDQIQVVDTICTVLNCMYL